jgi:hypothetical protein
MGMKIFAPIVPAGPGRETNGAAARSLLRKSHMTHQMTAVRGFKSPFFKGGFLFFGFLTPLWKRGEGEILFCAYR